MTEVNTTTSALCPVYALVSPTNVMLMSPHSWTDTINGAVHKKIVCILLETVSSAVLLITDLSCSVCWHSASVEFVVTATVGFQSLPCNNVIRVLSNILLSPPAVPSRFQRQIKERIYTSFFHHQSIFTIPVMQWRSREPFCYLEPAHFSVENQALG